MSTVLESLKDTPVALLQGSRQTGKSTLAEQIVEQRKQGQYVTLDNQNILVGAHEDPTGFLHNLVARVSPTELTVLDEIQRAPELLLAIKAEVDRTRRPGRFLLTGSANILLLPKIADSLAGRIELHTLWPLSQGEIDGMKEGFIDAVFAKTFPVSRHTFPPCTDLLQRICRGGYPEIHARPSAARQRAWFEAYITTMLQRDIRDLANIEGLTALPRVLALVATRAAGLTNYSELSRSLAIPLSTLKRYIALFEQAFLIHQLSPWSGNLGKRLVKTSKLFFNDTGLLAYVLGMDVKRLAQDHNHIGPLLENFVINELQKQRAWNRTPTTLFHVRTHTGQEVDVVIEDNQGRLVGIEVKAGATISPQDFKGLRALANSVGDRFHRGLVLYTGQSVVPLGSNLSAIPVTGLWSLGAKG